MRWLRRPVHATDHPQAGEDRQPAVTTARPPRAVPASNASGAPAQAARSEPRPAISPGGYALGRAIAANLIRTGGITRKTSARPGDPGRDADPEAGA